MEIIPPGDAFEQQPRDSPVSGPDRFHAQISMGSGKVTSFHTLLGNTVGQTPVGYFHLRTRKTHYMFPVLGDDPRPAQLPAQAFIFRGRYSSSNTCQAHHLCSRRLRFCQSYPHELYSLMIHLCEGLITTYPFDSQALDPALPSISSASRRS